MTIRSMVIRTRLSLGMTQEEMGSRIGYSPTLISDVECGRREPTMAFVAAVATLAARESSPPDLLPPDGLLRAQCAQCPVGAAYDDIAAMTTRRAA